MSKKPERLEQDPDYRLIDSTPQYQGRVIDLYRETVKGPTGMDMQLEIVKHPGGAAALAVNEQQQVCILKQYRHAAGGWIYEIPAGRIDPGESPLHTAKRELEEEAGIRAEAWKPLGQMWSTPGFCQEVISIYLARDLQQSRQALEADEFLEIFWIPWQQAVDWCRQGIICDSKTLAAIFYYQNALTV